MDSGLRVSILGGGSAQTPGLIEGFIRQKSKIPLERLVLMDIDGAKLQSVGGLVRAMVDAAMPGTEVVLTEDRREALSNADFIVCQIRVGGLAACHLDESIAAGMGLVGEETTGPGGFSMALRTIPVMVEIAKEIETVNPSAWLINYTNPTGLVAEAVRRTSSVKHVAICDEPMIMQEALAALVGTTPGRLFMDYFGLNHLGFARKVLYRGTDILPALRQKLQMMAPERVLAVFGDEVMKDPKAQQELANTLRIFGETGILPSPYLQYYYFTREIIEHQRESGRTHAEYAMEIEKNLLAEYNRVTSGKKKLEKSRRGKWQADMMVGLLGAIANDSREIYIVNVPNRGALPELPDNKIVEVPAVVDAAGPRPLAMGTMPVTVRGLIHSVAAYEELTVEAALSGSRRDALEALTCHPLVGSRETAWHLLDAYLDAHERYLPQFRK
jgi:6-phospho-beta-glucosidase